MCISRDLREKRAFGKAEGNLSLDVSRLARRPRRHFPPFLHPKLLFLPNGLVPKERDSSIQTSIGEEEATNGFLRYNIWPLSLSESLLDVRSV